jgi:hypothetical protein
VAKLQRMSGQAERVEQRECADYKISCNQQVMADPLRNDGGLGHVEAVEI